MGVQLNLGINGTVGVVNLTTSAHGSDFTAQRNAAYALTGNTAFTVTLPVPGPDDTFDGSVIYFKNLLDETMNGNTEIVTINTGGQAIDGGVQGSTRLETDTRFETFTLVYINSTIGWMIIQ